MVTPRPKRVSPAPATRAPVAGPAPFAPPADAALSGGMRINKFLALCGVASRRAADALVLQGAVRVNDRVVDTPGVSVDPDKDTVAVHGRVVALPRPGRGADPSSPAPHEYFLVHKPPQVVTTVSDPEGRRTVLDLLPADLRKRRLFPVGRLDYLSEGLLLLTTDGDLTHRLTHPKWHLSKVYEVMARGLVTEEALADMRHGMRLAEGERLAPVQAEIVDGPHQAQGKILLRLTLVQGVNRQIRRMCRDIGLGIIFLKRVQQGPILLGNLASGACRRLDPAEVRALRAAVGLDAGV